MFVREYVRRFVHRTIERHTIACYQNTNCVVGKVNERKRVSEEQTNARPETQMNKNVYIIFNVETSNMRRIYKQCYLTYAHTGCSINWQHFKLNCSCRPARFGQCVNLLEPLKWKHLGAIRLNYYSHLLTIIRNVYTLCILSLLCE